MRFSKAVDVHELNVLARRADAAELVVRVNSNAEDMLVGEGVDMQTGLAVLVAIFVVEEVHSALVIVS